jgi:flagellar biosynthesis GTPase FlhF
MIKFLFAAGVLVGSTNALVIQLSNVGRLSLDSSIPATTRRAVVAMEDDPVKAKKAAEAAAAAGNVAPAAAAKSDALPVEVAAAEKADEANKLAEEEAKAKAEAEEKAKKEAEEKAKKEAEAKKKAEAAAKAKKEAEEKVAAEKKEAIELFSSQTLVLTPTGAVVQKAATINERADFLREKGMDEKSIQAAMAEVGVEEVAYARDAWGRIIALNNDKYSPDVTPPKSDGFGQLRPRE